MLKSVFAAAAVACVAAPCLAAEPTTVTIAAPIDGNVLRAGIKVPMRTLVEMTTKKKAMNVGDRFNVETAEAIMSGNNVVIPSGTPGVIEITNVRNKGMWGKSGFIEGRVLYLRLAGRQIRMTGSFNDKGVTGTAGVVGAIALVPIAGFFTTGTSAQIAAGSILTAFLDEDIAFNVSTAAAPTPVQATPAVAVSPAEASSATIPAAPAANAPAAKPVAMVDTSLEIKAQ